MKKSNLIMIVVTISVFVVLLLGATYAYFASNTNVGNGLDMTITTDNNNIAFAATEGTLSMHVKAEDMLQSQTGADPVLAAETVGEDNIVITLSTNTETPIACTYNVYFQWNANQAYTTTNGKWQKELTLELNLNDEDSNGDGGINSFAEEKQITDVVTGTTKTKIVNGAYIVGNSSNSGTQEWIPTVRFYNLAKDQSALAGKTLGGKFTIEDVECNTMKNLSETVIGLVSDDEYISSQTEEDWYTNAQYNNLPYVVKHEEVEYNGTTYDAGVRYEGRNPDNYIIFNGELWRIIGTFEGSTIGLEPGKQYTKIIRHEETYSLSWDNNDWENSTLNTFLNNDYLNGDGQIVTPNIAEELESIKTLTLKSKNKIAKYNGNYSTWYLRAPSLNNYQTATTEDWFLMERLTGGLSSLNENDTIVSAVALMYPSDYGFAAYGDVCDTNLALAIYGDLNYETMERVGCAQVDWLTFDGTGEWLISPVANNSNDAFGVFGDDHIGTVITYSVETTGQVFRPVLYLEHSIKIAGGAGSLDNPYKLS